MVRFHTTSAMRRHAFIILTVLFAMNAGIAHVLIKQISITASAKSAGVVNEDLETLLYDIETESGNTNKPIAKVPTEEHEEKPIITTYTVRSGDTLSGIASKFGVSANTIVWENDLGTKTALKAGTKLRILPTTGLSYIVRKGDTISSIAKKFDTPQSEILFYNLLDRNEPLKVGEKLIIPDAVQMAVVKATVKKEAVKPVVKTAKMETVEIKDSVKTVTKSVTETVKTATKSKFINPIPGSILTQGRHGGNAVDFGAPIGTTVRAAAAGIVTTSYSDGGYHGGFGNYVVIKHVDGTETLYAHLDKSSVSVGESVTQGETIGKSGNTGRSTGPHLHFEVHGATNTFTSLSKGTKM